MLSFKKGNRFGCPFLMNQSYRNAAQSKIQAKRREITAVIFSEWCFFYAFEKTNILKVAHCSKHEENANSKSDIFNEVVGKKSFEYTQTARGNKSKDSQYGSYYKSTHDAGFKHGFAVIQGRDYAFFAQAAVHSPVHMHERQHDKYCGIDKY